MLYEWAAMLVGAQAAVVVLLSVWAYIFLRWIVPLLQPERQQAKAIKVKPPKQEQASVLVNEEGYQGAWADLKATLQAQKGKELYRSDVLALLTGIEQEHCGEGEETQRVRVIG